jgi:agmatinase
MSDFLQSCFLEANRSVTPGGRPNGCPVLLGCPYDGTASFRPGARFAPAAIRHASQGLESYSPNLDLDLEDISFQDLGDLELPFADQAKAFSIISSHVDTILNQNNISVVLGGEHTITIPIIQALLKHFPSVIASEAKQSSALKIIQLDAHLDLRDDYLGDKTCHATVMRRISELVGWDNILQLGVRSGTRQEWQLATNHHTIGKLDDIAHWVGADLSCTPSVYLTVDLDVFDPGVMGGVGTPEPGGWFYSDFLQFMKQLHSIHLVGLDVVELSPHYDPSGASSILAAKVVRELILLL